MPSLTQRCVEFYIQLYTGLHVLVSFHGLNTCWSGNWLVWFVVTGSDRPSVTWRKAGLSVHNEGINVRFLLVLSLPVLAPAPSSQSAGDWKVAALESLGLATLPPVHELFY